MKTIKLILILAVVCFISKANAQKYLKDKKLKSVEKINQEYQFNSNSTDNILVVDNVYGDIDVVGYDGNTIQVEVTKKVTADTQEDLQMGKDEIGIKSAKNNDAVYVYLDSPHTVFDLETGEIDRRQFSYNYNRSYKHKKRRNYRYNLDFKIKVPKNAGIDVRTVNNGNIKIENVHGKLLIVHNINGAIDMQNVSGKTDVKALNKDINITYSKNPTEESFYKSLNGDINIQFKKDLDANITYKTMNGGFYTNFDVEKTTPIIKTTSERKNKGTKYKVNSNKHFKIGNGNVALHFNQLNGDAIIKKI